MSDLDDLIDALEGVSDDYYDATLAYADLVAMVELLWELVKVEPYRSEELQAALDAWREKYLASIRDSGL
jgi:hypothetical protein